MPAAALLPSCPSTEPLGAASRLRGRKGVLAPCLHTRLLCQDSEEDRSGHGITCDVYCTLYIPCGDALCGSSLSSSSWSLQEGPPPDQFQINYLEFEGEDGVGEIQF